ncbi:hypothetical protein [Streptomyces sp. MK7]|uniref:hypothetical protein n=1 Tax=Streptomyces sp. MK7 TaxID=3067635 RepID=UPI002930CF5B|nr:hypothetical protein [Streptomyces sp. MK7]
MHRPAFLAATAGATGALALGAAPAYAHRRPSQDPEALLTHWFADTYRSLEAMVPDSGLPADNIKLGGARPVLTENTSSTNIGCWLWSTVAACGLGLISGLEMHRRLARTVTTVEKMERLHGFWFNWYNTFTGEVLDAWPGSGAPVSHLPASRGDVVLREVSTEEGCGFDIRVGKGRAVVITNNHRADLDFWTAALRELGAAPGITHDGRLPGVFFLTTTDPDGGRLLHVFNIASGYAQDVTVAARGKPLFGGERLHLPGRGAAMLPLGLTAGGTRIAYATAEISAVEEGRVTFRSLGEEAVVAVDGRARCSGAKVSFEGGRTLPRVRRAEFTIHRS